MDLNLIMSLAIGWLAFDALADCLCIALVLAIFATIRNIFKQSH